MSEPSGDYGWIAEELRRGRADAIRIMWLDLPGRGVARHADYAAAGDHRKESFYAVQGATVRDAIDAAMNHEHAARTKASP